MLAVSFEAESLGFLTFRIPTSTSIVRSFSVPPFTTIRGMISNAMRLQRDDFALQDNAVKIGLKILSEPQRNVETTRILKYVARNEVEAPLRRYFPSSPMKKELLFKAKYQIFVLGSHDTITRIEKSLRDPSRPLYFGQSDDLVDLSNIRIVEATEDQSDFIHSIIEGIHPQCEIVRLPYKFNIAKNSAALLYRTFSLPRNLPYRLSKEIPCYLIGEEHIAAY